MCLRPRSQFRSGLLLVLLTAASIPHDLRAAFKPEMEQCHAKDYTRFIGKPVRDLEQLELQNTRFVCNVCAATADVIATRLTVIYSEKSKLILKLFCQ
jgi:hypothetical protein